MADNNPNPNANANNGAQDGGNANQGGGNSQGQGGNQNQNQGAGQGGGNANQNANQGQGAGGNQAGGDNVDYKKKFGESTTENQKYREALKANGIDPDTLKPIAGGGKGNAGDQAAGGNDNGAGAFFTDEDLEATFPSFATMTDQEKQVLRQVGSFPKMARMVAEMHDKLTFGEQLEVLKADPANKLIADNEKEFKEFAYTGDNLKIPLDVLKDAFIGKKLREQNGGGGNQNQGGQQQGNQQQQRQGMEQGTNGQGASGDAAQEMTAEAARDLRTKDPRKYNALARAGKIKIVSGN